MGDPERLVVGRIGATYGVKGWVKVQSYTDPVENLIQYQPWQVHHQGQWQTIDILDTRKHGKGLVVHFANCHTPEDAAQYTNNEIAIERAQLPRLPEEEYYWHELEGLTVINHEQITLGTVDYLFEAGSQTIMVVKGEDEYLIPFVMERYIKTVDLAAKHIVVEWDR